MRQLTVAEVQAFLSRLLRTGIQLSKAAYAWFREQPNKVRVPIAVALALFLIWIVWPSKPSPASAATDPHADEMVFDPNAEGADPSWGEVVTISSSEVRDLTQKADRLGEEFPRVLARLQQHNRKVSNLLGYSDQVWKKHVQQTFHDARTPTLFYELAKDEVGTVNKFEKIVVSYQLQMAAEFINTRVAAAKVYLVGGKARVGDKLFIATISAWVKERSEYLDGQDQKMAEFDRLWAKEPKEASTPPRWSTTRPF